MSVCLALFLAALDLGPAPGDEPAQKVVIPFDFESKFDEGRYGQMVGDQIWAKLQRQGGFVIPETMQDVRDSVQRSRFLPNPTTPMEKMLAVAKEQAGDILIWGKVERVPPNETDVYDLWINVADFSVDPPKMIYTVKARTTTVSEIPHVYVKEALDKLHGRVAAEPGAPDPRIAERWAKNPNLVQGDFEKGTKGPVGWDTMPPSVTWIDEKGVTTANKVIRFQFGEDIAGSTGVLWYSDWFPVEEGATYRFQCRWRTTGSAAKVFIKCYDEFGSTYQDKGGGSVGSQRREVYRSQQNLQGNPKVWNTQTEDFTPKHTQFRPRWGRVMLYAYWPAGTVDWDDVVVKQIVPAPPSKGEKDRRPSTETKVRAKDMEKLLTPKDPKRQ